MAVPYERLEQALDERLPVWARWTALIVVASSAEVVITAGPDVAARVALLSVVWSVFWLLSVRQRAWAPFAVVVSLGGLAVYGWASVAPCLTTAAALALVLSGSSAVVAVGLYVIAGTLLVYWFNSLHPPSYVMQAHKLLPPVAMMFVFGRVLRSSVAMQRRAQSLAGKLNAANEILRHDLKATEVLATSKERARIARELHDSLGHSLATVHVQNQLARKLADGDNLELAGALDVVAASTKAAMKVLRDCVAVLREPADEQSLAERIRGVLRQLPADVLGHRLRVVGTPRRLLPAREFVLYRALQEGITNVAKHAQAQTAEVELRFDESGDVRLILRDDGVGTHTIRVGYGLRGIQERLESVGGDLELSSSRGSGFRLVATLRGSAA